MAAVLARVRREQIEYAQGRRPAPPVLDYLVISGGGDFGAFGAGVLKGWSRVPASDPLARPRAFDVVTGVSTGALIAPFAFVGDDDAIERINHLYRNPGPDWVKQRWPLFFLPNNISFAEVPGLEREVARAGHPRPGRPHRRRPRRVRRRRGQRRADARRRHDQPRRRQPARFLPGPRGAPGHGGGGRRRRRG